MTGTTAPARHREVTYERGANGVGYLVLRRPDKLNAVHRSMMGDLTEAFAAFHGDDAAAVAVLRGEGRAFCAGADVAARAAADGPPAPGEDLSRLPDLFLARDAVKPIVAAAHGHVVGMGLRMVLLADLALCTATTRFRAPEVGQGLDGGPYWWLLQARAGDAFATHAVATGREWSGAEAERRGLVTRCVAEDALTTEAEGLAAALAAQPRRALTALVDTRRQALRDVELTAWRARMRTGTTR
ncbi:2-(1,2-epoxy-1,2-dihydrophenyl)acetyl-CoA isomerase PaaG [Pseudonocardia ailaonensis]|uniref:2-(1,2-epoxy-1,2-dihydrophenyl)acetyl-CoA isomerase PaaG n=1 Tax=Pseudonocardia ailaonensis TaxID=367279 RepID=A0ABN2N0N3_9PSEU